MLVIYNPLHYQDTVDAFFLWSTMFETSTETVNTMPIVSSTEIFVSVTNWGMGWQDSTVVSTRTGNICNHAMWNIVNLNFHICFPETWTKCIRVCLSFIKVFHIHIHILEICYRSYIICVIIHHNFAEVYLDCLGWFRTCDD